jgi:cytidylate kinase
MKPGLIIAIDGPAGSGKSTVARRVAHQLGLFYIDTGAMYRCLALKARLANVPPTDTKRIIALAQDLKIDMNYDPASGQLCVTLDGEDVSQRIRDPKVTEHVSDIAKIKEVRECMVLMQRRLAMGRAAILEGRDTTTVVFPDAAKKFYLDALPDERIHRRFLEMKQKKVAIDEDRVKKDIETRDRIDTTREHSPLTRAADAVYIDTTSMTIDQVVDAVIRAIGTP